MLSTIERIIFLKSLNFFEQSPMNQLMALASASQTAVYQRHDTIVRFGEAVSDLYMVVSGQVKITQGANPSIDGQLLETRGYFGEDYVFDKNPSAFNAVATQDTMLLILGNEALLTFMKTDLNLSYNIIRMLSQDIRNRNEQIAQLSRQHSRDMHRIFDKLDK
jgi:CRP-like cAMP-binding protein